MFITAIPNRTSKPAILLREGYREGGKVKMRTLANLSGLPPEKIEALKAALRGEAVGAEPIIESSLPHGHVLAVTSMVEKLGLPKLLFGKRHRMRELALALVAGRVIEPSSKLSLAQALAKGAEHHTLGEVLGLGELGKAIDSENPESSQEKRAAGELYAAMDWLLERQEKIEDALAKRHLTSGCTVLYDLSSSYFEGSTCPLAKYGYSRDHRKDRPQVQYGLLCNEDGIPVAIEVVEGNTGDPKTIPAQVERLKGRFGLERVVVVGDRGMVTEARIREDIATVGYDWISALVHKSILPLVEAKVITPSLFDERGLGEISHPDYPGERLIACYNPIRAEEQVRKREELLALTERGLQKVADACVRKRDPLKGVAEIGIKTGAALGKFKMAKFFSIRVHGCGVSWHLKPELLAKDASMDGIYVIRTSVPKELLEAEKAVLAYKRLAKVERAFRTMKSVDLQVRPYSFRGDLPAALGATEHQRFRQCAASTSPLTPAANAGGARIRSTPLNAYVRPIYHRTEERVKAHLFICMLAYYVEWHLRQVWAPLLYADEEGSQRDTPVSPVQASASGKLKKKRAHGVDGLPLQSFGGLMKSLAALSLSRVRVGQGGPLCIRMAKPTALQARAFDLIEVAAK